MSGTIQPIYNLKITAFPRIHMTLIGMNADGYRINGGIGFSISEPKIYISFKASKFFSFVDSRIGCFIISEIERLKLKIEEIKSRYGFKYSISCEISGQSLTHYGFGTSTATYLACIEALFILNDYPYDNDLIRKNSGRGGTSGIGIYTYFNGGFILDAGIPNTQNDEIAPSSISTKRSKLPLILNQVDSPNWKIGIVIPTNIKNKTEKEEINFFKKTCPIEREKVDTILYESIYGALSAIYENDFGVFSSSVKRIQSTKWKMEERSLYGDSLSRIEAGIYNSGATCVGMSSLGPGLYFLSENIENTYSQLSDENYYILKAQFNNNARIVEHE